MKSKRDYAIVIKYLLLIIIAVHFYYNVMIDHLMDYGYFMIFFTLSFYTVSLIYIIFVVGALKIEDGKIFLLKYFRWKLLPIDDVLKISYYPTAIVIITYNQFPKKTLIPSLPFSWNKLEIELNKISETAGKLKLINSDYACLQKNNTFIVMLLFLAFYAMLAISEGPDNPMAIIILGIIIGCYLIWRKQVLFKIENNNIYIMSSFHWKPINIKSIKFGKTVIFNKFHQIDIVNNKYLIAGHWIPIPTMQDRKLIDRLVEFQEENKIRTS